jgi:hypothetical protein
MATANYKGKQFFTYLDSDKAWELIEQKTMGYNVDMDILYPEHFHTDKNSIKYCEILDKLVMEEEQYSLFDSKCEGYAITSFGRVFNAKHINQVVVYFSRTEIKTTIRQDKINFATEFARLGWSFNINDIKRKYDENKWKYQKGGVNYHMDPK